MKKAELRKIYKQKRQDLSLVEIVQLQQSIYNQIYDLDVFYIKKGENIVFKKPR